MHLRLVPAWPFFEWKPSEREVKVREALRNFEKVEQRALHDQRIDELKDEISDLTEEARRINGNGRA